MKRKYESEILQMCHEEVMGLHEIGAISDERMREFDEMYLIPEVPHDSRRVIFPSGAQGCPTPD